MSDTVWSVTVDGLRVECREYQEFSEYPFVIMIRWQKFGFVLSEGATAEEADRNAHRTLANLLHAMGAR